MPIIPTSDMPTLYQPYARMRGKRRKLMGVHVGPNCIDGSRLGSEHAHAHTDKRRKYYGWICFRQKYWPVEKTQIHELAHILTGDGHTARWRAKYVELGGDPKADWSYQRWEAKLIRRRAIAASEAPAIAALLF